MNRPGSIERPLALALIALGVGLRVWLRYPTDFWEDEIIAATHSMLPLWLVLVECLRNDVHPPLYFLQLDVWGWAGRSDLWLTLNSLAWGLGAIWSVWRVASRLYDARTGLLAAAFLAVMPAAVFNSDQLRMYAMLSVVLIWSFYFSLRVFRDGRRSLGWVAGHTLLLIAIVNLHAIASIAVLTNGLYALALLRERPDWRRGLWLWLAVYAVAALCALPWLVTGLLHDANLGEAGGLAGVLQSLAGTVLGYIIYGSPAYEVLGILAFCVLAAMGLSRPQTRMLTLVFIVLPLVLSAALAVAVKPLFKWNFFSTQAAPFIALVPALLMREPAPGRGIRTMYVPLLVGVLCVVSIATRLTLTISSGYRYDAGLIRANYQPGDLVFAPQQSYFWGMAWYLVGPDWGSPLQTAAAPSAQWQSVYRRLGPRLVAALHLMPQSQTLAENGVRLLAGNDSAGQATGATRIWLVTTPRADLKPGYPPQTLNGLPPQWSDHRHAWVTLYAATPQHVTVPPGAD